MCTLHCTGADRCYVKVRALRCLHLSVFKTTTVMADKQRGEILVKQSRKSAAQTERFLISIKRLTVQCCSCATMLKLGPCSFGNLHISPNHNVFCTCYLHGRYRRAFVQSYLIFFKVIFMFGVTKLHVFIATCHILDDLCIILDAATERTTATLWSTFTYTSRMMLSSSDFHWGSNDWNAINNMYKSSKVQTSAVF